MKSWGKEKRGLLGYCPVNWCRDDYLCPSHGWRRGRSEGEEVGEGEKYTVWKFSIRDWTGEQAQESAGLRRGNGHGDCLHSDSLCNPTLLQHTGTFRNLHPTRPQGSENPLWRNWTCLEEDLDKLTLKEPCWERKVATWLACQLMGYLRFQTAFFLFFNFYNIQGRTAWHLKRACIVRETKKRNTEHFFGIQKTLKNHNSLKRWEDAAEKYQMEVAFFKKSTIQAHFQEGRIEYVPFQTCVPSKQNEHMGYKNSSITEKIPVQTSRKMEGSGKDGTTGLSR